MYQPRFVSTVSCIALLFFLSVVFAAAQPEARPQFEPNYAITLQVVVGSSEPGAKGEMPQNLGNITRQLRSEFPFTNYRLASTFLGRVSNGGNLEYKSVSDVLGRESEAESQTFLEWKIGGFRVGTNGFQIQGFRFGAHVPVRAVASRDNALTNPVVNYEPIGLNLTKVGMAENVPTLLGTLTLPKTNGILFLIITVSPADR